jgi:hypothetical protein
MILIQFSIIISSQAEKNKNLTQEHGIMKFEMDNLKSRIQRIETEIEE